jgi:hypothetical protein
MGMSEELKKRTQDFAIRIIRTGLVTPERPNALMDGASQVVAIAVSSIKTARKSHRVKKRNTCYAKRLPGATNGTSRRQTTPFFHASSLRARMVAHSAPLTPHSAFERVRVPHSALRV